MKNYFSFFRVFILFLFVSITFQVSSQINHALTAVSSHSGGGANAYSAANYNDNIIPSFGNLPWGWVSSNGFIEYTWTSPTSINAVVFYKDGRGFTSLVIDYWNGVSYVPIMTVAGSTNNEDSITFNAVTTTKLRFSSIAGSNPNFREIKAYFNSSAPLDASVLSVDSPSFFCSGMQDVYATIVNRGTTQIDSVTVGWEVNGISGAPVLYNSLLDTLNGLFPSQAQVLLGSAMFNVGSNSITVFTSMPNGVVDTVTFNDTLAVSVSTATPPQSILVLNPQLTTVDIQVSGYLGSLDYEYGIQGFVQGTGVVATANTPLISLSGLTPSTTYEIYVRSVCSPTDRSTWVGPIRFSTSNGIPYFEDFTNLTAGLIGPTYGNGWTSVSTTTPRWETETTTGSNNNSTATGPLYDATTPTVAGGKYIYFETSGGGLGSSNSITSPPVFVPLSAGGLIVEFSYHMHGATMGDLYVLVDTNNVSDTIFSISGQQQVVQSDPWKDTSALLVGYQGKAVQLTFVGVRGSSFTGDISIDDVRLFDTVAVDVALDSILTPFSDCGLSASEDVTIAIQNRGLSPATGVSATFVLDGGAPVTETVPVTINPGTTYNYTFTTKVNATQIKSYTLDARISLANDGDSTNNSLLGYSFISSFSDTLNGPTKYYNFENDNGNWVASGINSSWEWGTPSTFYINGAIGNKAWVTSAAGNHNSDEISFLESSCFDFSSIPPSTQLLLYFRTLYKTEIGFDQIWMEYSINNGLSWMKLMPSIASINFYNNTTANVWEGFSVGGVGTWLPVLNDLPALGGNSKVKFRFAFVSNSTIVNDGFAFDEFQIGTVVSLGEKIKTNRSTFTTSPNPASSNFTATFSGFEIGAYQFEITDVNGRLIKEEYISMISSLQSMEIDVSGAKPGLYFVRMTNGKLNVVQKIIIR